MEKKFKIELPPLDINKEQRIMEINTLLSSDFEKGGILNQCIVFLYNLDVATTTELADEISRYYKKEIDRGTVYRAMERLIKMDVAFSRNSGYLMTTMDSEMSEVEKYMLAKFKKFLNTIPQAFKNRYTDMNFFALSNGFGLEFVEWSCKILKFKCSNIK